MCCWRAISVLLKTSSEFQRIGRSATWPPLTAMWARTGGQAGFWQLVYRFRLVQQGWQVTCFPVAVSHSGLVTSTARAALERCGVAPRLAATAVRRLVRSALAYNVQIRT